VSKLRAAKHGAHASPTQDDVDSARLLDWRHRSEQVGGARCIGSPRRNHASANLLDTALWVIASAARDTAAARRPTVPPSLAPRDTDPVLGRCGRIDGES
jgi:hypothetical protein